MRAIGCLLAGLIAVQSHQPASARPRARELGIAPGAMETGPLNAITDVAGVLVGHTTIAQGDTVRTGVTAILPHGGNLLREKVPGAGTGPVDEGAVGAGTGTIAFGWKRGIGTSSRRVRQQNEYSILILELSNFRGFKEL